MTFSVAPLVGAWIEIASNRANAATDTSLLSWERGLKLLRCGPSAPKWCVAPLVGAWIEIPNFCIDCPAFSVAPLVGAWIEIKWS